MPYPTAPIDLRSDTVTRPSEPMRRAMAEASVGDDVYREDPTVERLQEMVADMLGKEAALFVPSGTMSNQLCLRTLTHMGDEVIVHEDAHVLHYEGGSAAALSALQLRPVPGAFGVLSPEAVAATIRPAGEHFAHTGAVEMENTHNRCGGTIWPLEAMQAVAALARAEGIKIHLDGARLWNAHKATGVALRDYAATADSVSVCFSKGLGAPVGSALAGSYEFVEEGAGQPQAFRRSHEAGGHHCGRRRLRAREQHRPAGGGSRERRGTRCRTCVQVPGLEIRPSGPDQYRHRGRLPARRGGAGRRGPQGAGSAVRGRGAHRVRFVTHLDVSAEAARRAGEIAARVLAALGSVRHGRMTRAAATRARRRSASPVRAVGRRRPDPP